MNFQFYVEKLNSFPDYIKFIEENKKAFPCSCFFVIDFQGEDSKQHFDFYVPNPPPQTPTNSRPHSLNSEHPIVKSLAHPKKNEVNDNNLDNKGKYFSFQLENSKFVPVEVSSDKIPEKISLDLEFDFKEIEDLILKRMEKDGIKNKVQKFLFSLQRKDGKHFLVGTVFISSLGLIKSTIDLEKVEIVDFEKKSFFDVMKVKKGK